MRRLRLERPGVPPIVVDEKLVTIGRSDSNVLVLQDSRISSLHGEIAWRDGNYYYRDLGSTNGSLVSRGDEKIVVDGTTIREARLHDGDELHLGDRAQPVLLQVAIEELVVAEAVEKTIVARREVTTVEALGTQVVDNPLASRQTITRLFNFFSDLSTIVDRRRLAERMSAFLLDLLPNNAFAGAFFKSDGSYERAALMTRDANSSPVVTIEEIRRWFPDVLAGRAALALALPEATSQRLGRVEMLAASPLPAEGGAVGVAVVGRRAAFSAFDLDLLSLVAHHAALQLEKIGLIEQLERANQMLSSENRTLRNRLDESDGERPMLGQSPAWKRSLRQAELVANADTTVLILGETGTGKELVANAIHQMSDRRSKRFAAVNCGALADTLLESELFGHMKGSFTGADRNKKGLFQVADQGTLFLDEIGDVSPSLQVKLLRALEAGDVTPVGSSQPIRVDVRVVAATHRNLDEMVADGRFREDLYYRINVFPILLPPLRERPGDITLLAEFFLERYSQRLGKVVAGLDPMAVSRLESYRWPGNVRQLENEIHRAVVLADRDKPLNPELLSNDIGGLAELPAQTDTLKAVMSRLEEQYIRRILRDHDDNRTQTAKTLGISRQALTEKLRRYNLVERRS